jgi:Flp pilus assembly protein TadD
MAFEKARECEGGDENADTLNELAICQMETGELSEAKNTLVEALEMDPDSTKIISNLGFLSLKSGNEAEARQYFLTVLEIDPEDPIAKAELKELSKEV